MMCIESSNNTLAVAIYRLGPFYSTAIFCSHLFFFLFFRVRGTGHPLLKDAGSKLNKKGSVKGCVFALL
jgi:hypothetical protein